MQYRPTATELLDVIAALLEDEVLPAVDGPLQHKVRVAANLARILQRESESGPAALEQERRLLAGLLGHDGPLDLLRDEASNTMRHRDDPQFVTDAWDVLVAVARDDLAIAKPGHDAWEGE